MDPSQKLNKHYYYVLGLACTASPSAIRSAYRKLALVWHPDRCRNEGLAAAANLKFQEIQEAYAVLSDVRKKLLYDNGLYNPNDDEADVEGLSSLFKEVSNKIAEIKAAEKIGGKEKSYEEFRELCDSLFKTNSQVAHYGYAPISATTSCSYKDTHFGYSPIDFGYPATQFDYPTVNPKTASLENKRDGWPEEGYLSSVTHRNEHFYDSFDMSHASLRSVKRRKGAGEQNDSPHEVCISSDTGWFIGHAQT